MSALLSDSGLDTVRFRWREDNVAFVNFRRRPEGTIDGQRGEAYVQTPLGRIGAYPDGLFYLEGRASAILHRDPDDHDLLAAQEVTTAAQVSFEYLREQGAPLSDNEAVRLGRVDLASEIRFADPSEGSAFLHSLACLDVPWCKSRVDGRKGDSIETVSFHGTRGKTIYLRAYDKGVESRTAPPGMRIRVERQKRYRKDREPFLGEFASSDLHKLYLGREFERLAELPFATVCDVPEALSVLCEFDLPPLTLLRLAGFLVVGQYVDLPTPSWYRYHAELRDLGIFVDPTQVERLEVPVGQYLQTLGAAWAA